MRALDPAAILISPGPGRPEDAGISNELIKTLAGAVPILGVCLGHQAIGAAFGGNIIRAKKLMHGKTSPITHGGKGVFQGLESPLTATRYHSLIIERDTIPAELEITACTSEEDGSEVIMGVRHRKFPVEGVQFHPESVLTPRGRQMLKNFIASV